MWEYNYTDELYHFGVKGMKWGVRNQRKIDTHNSKAASHINKIGTSKTRLGKNYHNIRAYSHQAKSNIIKSRLNETGGVLKKIDNSIGFGRATDTNSAIAKYYDRKAGYSSTKLGKSINKARAYNNERISAKQKNIHNSSSAKQAGQRYVDAVTNTKLKRWSGRSTTSGKEFVRMMVAAIPVAGLVSEGATLAKDVRYYKNNAS